MPIASIKTPPPRAAQPAPRTSAAAAASLRAGEETSPTPPTSAATPPTKVRRMAVLCRTADRPTRCSLRGSPPAGRLKLRDEETPGPFTRYVEAASTVVLHG